MQEMYCSKRCCVARYCPLTLSWAMTVHKFQGFEAGFDEDDKIHHIIANINNLKWEKDHPGTAYTVASRAKTIGTITPENQYPIDSNLFFEGQIGENRFTDILYNIDGEMSLNAQKRRAWTEYLDTRAADTSKRLQPSIVNNMKESLLRNIHHPLASNNSELETRIMDIIKQPNEKWKKEKSNYVTTS